MSELSKSDLELLLHEQLTWSDCQNCRKLLLAIKDSLVSLLSAEIQICLSQQEPESQPSERSFALSKRSSPLDFEFFVTLPNGLKLEILISSPGPKSLSRDMSLLKELQSHIATAFKNVHRVEFLNHALAKSRQRNKSGPAMASFSNWHLLTERELDTVSFVCKGLNNGEIAEQMNITRRTVEKHLESCYEKLCLENRYQLMTEGLK